MVRMAARRVRLAAVGVAATAAAALALPGASLAAAAPRASQGRVLAAPTLPAGTRVLAATPAAERVQASIVLQPRNAPALAAFARSVTDVRSARFRHYLARGAFTARFGPAADSIGAVERFAAAAGLRVGALSSNHLVLTVSGPAARFDLAFATRLSQVRLPDGTVGRVTTAPVRLPAAVAPSIVAVVGLDDVLHARTWTKRPTHLRRPYGTRATTREEK
jgi:kumamolisin